MENFLSNLLEVVVRHWLLLLILTSAGFALGAWLLPTWRGNALAACGGFAVSIPAAMWASDLAHHRPKWARGMLQWLDREIAPYNSPALHGEGTHMAFTLLVTFFAFLIGLVFFKLTLRGWHYWRGDSFSEQARREILSPYH